MRKIRIIVSVALTGIFMAASIPAGASAAVTLRVSLGDRSVAKAVCSVAVAEGADGVAVLDAAVAGGCIKSYKIEDFGWGDYLACVDGVCEQPGTYWAMYENRVYTSYGIREFYADPGDELWFNYEQYITCLTPLGC